MSQVSKYPIRKEVADRIFDVFINSLIKIRDKKEANDLANDLFSPTEKIMLAKRLAIAFLIIKGYQYRTISKILRVSLGTIASVNISLKKGNGYKSIIQKITSEEKLSDFFDEMLEKIISIPASSKQGGGVWRYLKEEVKAERRAF